MELNEDLKLKLLAGLPIKVSNIGKIKQYKLKEIIDYGYSKYNYNLGLIINVKDLVDDKEVDLSKINDFELSLLIAYYNQSFKKDFINALSYFFNEPVFFHKDGFYYLGNINERRFILDKNFEDIQDVIKHINCIKIEKEPSYNPANEYARKLIEQIKKNKEKMPKKRNVNSNVDLHSMISGLSWKSYSVNIINIWDLTIYQLYDAMSRMEVVDYYEGILRGLFAGTIDGKKINLTKINWAKIIKN